MHRHDVIDRRLRADDLRAPRDMYRVGDGRDIPRMQLWDARRVASDGDVRWTAEHHQHEAFVMYI